MRIFKNKVFRGIILVLLVICMVILLDNGLGYMLSPVKNAAYYNMSVKEIEDAGENADIVFIGASRTHQTFDPKSFETVLGVKNVLNAASSGAPMSGTYYTLVDLIERVHPSQVFIGVSWNGLRTRGGLQNRLLVYDMLSIKNKIRMAVNCIQNEESLYLFSVYRFKDNLTESDIRENLKAKARLKEYSDAAADTTRKDARYKGFLYYSGGIETGNVPLTNFSTFEKKMIKSDSLKYLDTCIRLCKEKGIQVALVSGVTTLMRIYAIQNYQEAVDYYQALADQYGIPYYNLNYLRDREEFLPDEMMHDSNHSNGEGGRQVSMKFAEILQKAATGEDVSDYFYRDVDELKQSVHRIVGMKVDFTRPDPENRNLRHLEITSVQNEDVPVIYRILRRRTEEEEYEVLQDWTQENKFDIDFSGEPKCILRVEAASTDETIGHAFQEYTVTEKSVKGKWDDYASD